MSCTYMEKRPYMDMKARHAHIDLQVCVLQFRPSGSGRRFGDLAVPASSLPVTDALAVAALEPLPRGRAGDDVTERGHAPDVRTEKSGRSESRRPSRPAHPIWRTLRGKRTGRPRATGELPRPPPLNRTPPHAHTHTGNRGHSICAGGAGGDGDGREFRQAELLLVPGGGVLGGPEGSPHPAASAPGAAEGPRGRGCGGTAELQNFPRPTQPELQLLLEPDRRLRPDRRGPHASPG